MVFKLKDVVPWGRNMSEYVSMFDLTTEDLNKRIISFADGPASFNYEATKAGYSVTSLDVVYQFSASELERRITETKEIVLEQTKQNAENYHWHKIKDIDDLKNVRMDAMKSFLLDYGLGKSEERYIFHEFPKKTGFKDNFFDLGLCSHFLFLYPSLGIDFHLKTVLEMVRICKEVRISPVVDLDGNTPEFLKDVIDLLSKDFELEIHQTDYAFLKGENNYLSIIK